ncbi:uncharacterized protein LOC128332596 isoform X4 [Hemicordylus capensis]|uniref:uncharacterized protein LOC128332596 isoform X4 n=1 Tax=Hemicordylus capensis TaxID=884348 RepID=UPI0023023B56|nr:uncharacterized protein LOC128332596 isoform X4 [Hemicordylus capensis]
MQSTWNALLEGMLSPTLWPPQTSCYDFQPQETNEERSVAETSKWSLKSFSDGSRIQHVNTGNEILDEGVATSSRRSVFTVEDDGWFLQTIATELSCEGADIQEAKIPEVNTRDQELDVESFISSPSVQRPSTVQRRLHNTAADQEPSLGESSSFPGAETPHASMEDEGSEGDCDTSSPRVLKPKKWLLKKMMMNTYTVEDSSSAECSSTDEDDTMHNISSIEDEVWDSPPTPSSARNIDGEEAGRGQLAPDWFSSVHLGEGRATKKIGDVIRCVEYASEVEERFPELLVGLVNKILTGLQNTTEGVGNRDSQDLPPEETAQIVRTLLERVAQVTPEKTCWESLCSPQSCLQGVALLVRALLQTPSSTVARLKAYLASLFSLDKDPEQHSLAEVAFFVELLLKDKDFAALEKTWTLLVAWLVHPSQNIRYLSERGLLQIYGKLKAAKKPQDFSAGILGGLRTSSLEATLGVLAFMERLRHCPSEHQATVNAVLAALCRPLFHHEEAKIRRAAMKTHLDLLQHRHHHHEGTEENITTLIAVLMHVEDEDLEVAQAAKDNLSLLAEALLWHLEGRLLARDSYSLQELLHKIAKRLIRQLGTEDAVEMEAINILGFFRSEQPSVRRTAALLIGHLVHKKGSILTEGNIETFHAALESLLGDHDPEVGTVACKTEKILKKAFSLHSRHGLRAAVRRLWAGCKKKRHPPEYGDLST